MRLTRFAALVSAVAAATAGVVLPAGGAARASTRATTTNAVTHYVMNQTPIASRASLGASTTVPVAVTALDSGNHPVPGATVYLTLNAPSGATATAHGPNQAPVGLGATPKGFTTSSSGIVNVAYTTPKSLPLHATDVVTAQNQAASPTISQQDTYTYDRITGLAWNGGAQGATVMLNNGPNTLQVTPGGTQTVYLAINPGGTAVGTAVAQSTPPKPLTNMFQAFTTSNTGSLTVNYSQGASATNAVDRVVAREDPAAGAPAPEAVAQHVYSGTSPQPAASIAFSQSPIAKAGSIDNGGSASFTAQTLDATGAPTGNQAEAACLMRHSGSDARGQAGGSALALCPAATMVTSDQYGVIPLTFTAASSAASGGNTGLDSIEVGNAAPCTPPSGTCISPAVNSQDYYNYTAVAQYVSSSGSPDFAPDTSLGGNNKTTSFTVTARNADGSIAVAHATVYLTFSQVPSGGTMTENGTAMASGSQVAVETDTNGQVSFMYTASSTPPSGGRDILYVSSDASPQAGTVATMLWYDYNSIDSYNLSPTTPIAPDGTIAPGSQTEVDINPVADTNHVDGTVYLSFTKSTGGGSATATSGSTTITLTSTPQALSTTGQSIQVFYTAPATLPDSGGQDVLSIADSTTNPAATAYDGYTFALVDGYSFSSPFVTPRPAAGAIAPTGSLAPAVTTEVDLQTLSGTTPQAGFHQVKVALTPTGSADGAATATACTDPGSNPPCQSLTALTATPQTFQTDGGGQLRLFYKTPAVLPNRGTDVLTATQANGGSATGTDSYAYTSVTSYGFSTVPIARAGSLMPGAPVAMSVSPLDSLGHPVTGTHRVYLAFTRTNGGGSVTAGSTGIDGSGSQGFLTAPDGSLGLTYTAPSVLPRNGGTDYLFAYDTPSGTPGVASGFTQYDFLAKHGYWLVASDGGVFPHGPDAAGLGSHGGSPLNQPIVGMAAAPNNDGYWLVASDGGIFPYGSGAVGYGSTGGMHLNKPIVGMAATPNGGGYWLVASDGGIFPFGNAGSFGSEGGTPLNKPIVGMASTPDGGGYWLVASDGGIFTHGNAVGYGSHGGEPLNKPIVGMAPTPDGGGYWLVASDGGIFPYGDAVGYGSTGGMTLNKPIVGMAASGDGQGYWLVASDGGIFRFGDAGGYGSEGGTPLNHPIVGMAAAG